MVPSAVHQEAEILLTHARRNALPSFDWGQPRNLNMSKMPPIPPGNQSTKGPKLDAEAERDTSKENHGVENSAEQGDTANIKQNTTNAGFFKGRRVK
jgi:hypothetical protein